MREKKDSYARRLFTFPSILEIKISIVKRVNIFVRHLRRTRISSWASFAFVRFCSLSFAFVRFLNTTNYCFRELYLLATWHDDDDDDAADDDDDNDDAFPFHARQTFYFVNGARWALSALMLIMEYCERSYLREREREKYGDKETKSAMADRFSAN